MAKINILEEKVYNQIAAGEVVERPSSVVKELIENSIDAGATSIKIEIKNAGLALIKITDNGSGIEKTELNKVFLKHATSKLNKIDDLNNLLSFGFRGEALASIASVSNVTLSTKTKADETATKIYLSGNKIIKTEEVKHQTGTTIEVINLFENVPARKKFLKTNKTEESEITNVISKIALAKPELKKIYVVDDKEKFNLNGNGIEEVFFEIYGTDASKKSIIINDKTDDGKLKLTGIICSPDFNKKSKTWQNISLNGRIITNATISSACMRAFEPYLMHGCHSVFALNVSLEPTLVDVNVHPRKLEVRFEKPEEIFKFIYKSITNAILNHNQNKSEIIVNNTSFNLADEINSSISSNFNFQSDIKNNSLNSNLFASNGLENDLLSVASTAENSLIDDSFFENMKRQKQELQKRQGNYIEPTSGDLLQFNANGFNNNDVNFNNQSNQMQSTFEAGEQLKSAELNKNFKILGTIFATYILCEVNNDLILIDEHATHERMIFDKLTADMDSKNLVMQPLLVPFVFSVSSFEMANLERNLNLLKQMGFDVDEFGNNSFKISAVPLVLKNINLNTFVENLKTNEMKLEKNSDLILNRLKQRACKAAIRAGDVLEKAEILKLLEDFENNKTIPLCPHGRPVFIKFSKTELEKLFKRIV
jgi:DNA mismatch repair protein MutL